MLRLPDNETDTPRCASCGVKESDEVKVKKCAACHLVGYCGVKCQKEHWKEHKRACKERAAELRDEILFRQPKGSHHGDCPICFLPISIDANKSTITPCCCTVICWGCQYATQKREEITKQDHKCPFCRIRMPESQTEADNMIMDRASEINNPVAMYQLGRRQYRDGDYQRAFEHLSKAAALGSAAAHYDLAAMYRKGSVVEKDGKKEVYHFEQAAIGGHALARHDIGAHEWNNGRCERAVKHWIIAAKLGEEPSMNHLQELAYKKGLVSKDDLAEVLLMHQAAVAATKSPQRDEGEAARAALQHHD